MTRLLSCLTVLLVSSAAWADGFEQRYLWTWDHRMQWGDTEAGGEVMGGGEEAAAVIPLKLLAMGPARKSPKGARVR